MSYEYFHVFHLFKLILRSRVLKGLTTLFIWVMPFDLILVKLVMQEICYTSSIFVAFSC
jgi:hypothetical protein